MQQRDIQLGSSQVASSSCKDRDIACVVPTERMGEEEILTVQVGGVEFAVGQSVLSISQSHRHATGATACPELVTMTPNTATLVCRPSVNSHERKEPSCIQDL